MTVPSVPADVPPGGPPSSSHMNTLLDVADFLLNTAPAFVGQAWSDVAGTSADLIGASTGTNTTFGFGEAGAFHLTPVMNIGSWTTQASDSDPESLVVPESGHYRVSISFEFEANSTGYRYGRLQLNGSSAGERFIGTVPAATVATRFHVSGLIDLAANDQLDLLVLQNSGNQLDVIAYLSLDWIRST